MFENATILTCTNEEYHAFSAWSQSALKLLAENVELFHGRYILQPPKWPHPETASMALGTLVHGLLLGGESVIEIPPEALTSNGQRRGKAWEAFCAANPGAILVKPEEYALARGIADNVLANPTAARILAAPGPTEESLFWADVDTILPLKARPDKQATFASGETIIADLKVVRDPTAKGFSYAIEDYGYHVQAAFYLDAMDEAKSIKPEAFVFICVRNEPPFECRVWELAGSAIELGREQYRAALADLSRRLVSDCWISDGAEDCHEIDLPPRAYKEP
jgi:hypothetical protein